jgi:D-hydroxyproline dehydrogenase
MRREEALVIGGGIVGTCCAIELQRRGIATLVLDPATEIRPASWGNAGHIATEQVEPLASPAILRGLWRQLAWRGGPVSLPLREIGAWLPFGLRFAAATRRFAVGKAALSGLVSDALPAWRALLAEAGASDLLIEDGHYVVWESESAASQGRAGWAQRDTGAAEFREATSEELRRLGVPIAGGLRFSGSGHIADPGALAEALNDRLAALGGRRVRAAVDRIEIEKGKAVVVAGATRHAADTVLVAAGTGSRPLLEGVGHKVPLVVERGYHIEARAPAWPADLPPIVFEERAMIATRFRSGLRVAGLFEFIRPGARPDPRKWARLRGHAAALGLPFDGPVTEWSGARPTLPDYLPAIGHSRQAGNLFYAFGHQHLGLTLAAVTAKKVGQLVGGEAADLAAFDLERFTRRV